MTAIVGLCEGGKVYIGGDSAGVANFAITTRADQKVFRNGDFIMGFTDSFRMGQLLRYIFTPPPRRPDEDVFAFMVNDFVNTARKCLKSGGFTKVENNVETGGNFLVGYEGRLFRVSSDYQVGESACGYDAIGCGDGYALGSLYTSNGDPRKRVKTALKAAQEFSAGVREPFHIEVL